MKNLAPLIIEFSLLFASTTVFSEWQPDNDNDMELSVAQAILKAKEKDETLAKWFTEEYK
jgi:hypothetical protein